MGYPSILRISILSALLFFTPAYALHPNQLISNTSSSVAQCAHGERFNASTTGKITGVRLKISTQANDSTHLIAQICGVQPADDSVLCQSIAAGGAIPVPTSTGEQTLTFKFILGSPFDFGTVGSSTLVVGPRGDDAVGGNVCSGPGIPAVLKAFGSDTDTVPNAVYKRSSGPSSPGAVTDANVKDLFYEWLQENRVRLLFPKDTTSTVGHFKSWRVNYILFTDVPGKIRIRYGTNASDLNFLDETSAVSPVAGTTDILKMRLLTPGVWFARAELLDSANTLLATSSLLAFAVVDRESLVISEQPYADGLSLKNQGHFEHVNEYGQTFEPWTAGAPSSIQLFWSAELRDTVADTCHVTIYETGSLSVPTGTIIAVSAPRSGTNCFNSEQSLSTSQTFRFSTSSPAISPGKIYSWQFFAQNVRRIGPGPGETAIIAKAAEDPIAGFPNGDLSRLSLALDLQFILFGETPKVAIANLQQFKSDATSTIPEGGTTTEDQVVFGALPQSSSTNPLRLEVEYTTSTFTGTPNATSSPVNPGSQATTTAANLRDGSYRWRARGVDTVTNAQSDWIEFGTPGNVDFIVKSLGQAAANLARELVNSAYLYGGKGWDYGLSQFVAPSVIKSGYNFWNQASGSVAFGTGVDCSGLIMWAYNRGFDPLKPHVENFVKAENANEQFRNNTTSTTETQLKPGDVMFFDLFPITAPDNFIDHVAMYVGESGGFDVVSAVDENTGIVPRSKGVLRDLSRFRGFKRVVEASPPAVLASASSPVDLVMIDPDGFMITPTTTVPSDLEYIREIPGVLYYSETERSADGNPIDRIYSYISKTGDYVIRVLPIPGASPTTTYTLDFSTRIQSITLAEDVSVNQIPPQGYGVTVSTAGTISPFIPVEIDIEPETLNLRSRGVFTLFITISPTIRIDTSTIRLEALSPADVKIANDKRIIAKFSRQDFVKILPEGEVRLTMTASLLDGTSIKGVDLVRVIDGASLQQISILLASLYDMLSRLLLLLLRNMP